MGNEVSRSDDPFNPYPCLKPGAPPAASNLEQPVSPKDTASSKDASSKIRTVRPGSARPASMTAKAQRPASASPHSAQSSPELHYSPAQQRLLDKAKENKASMVLQDRTSIAQRNLHGLSYTCCKSPFTWSAPTWQVWMRSNQTAVSGAAEIRQPKPRFPYGGRPVSARPDLSSQMGQVRHFFRHFM